MKIARHRTERGPALAVVEEGDVLIDLPPGCGLFDYELEVAAVVGRADRDMSAGEAEDYIAGFAVLNDFSARNFQFHQMRLRLGPAKGKDTATALGTFFITADELAHRRSEELGGTCSTIVSGPAAHEIPTWRNG